MIMKTKLVFLLFATILCVVNVKAQQSTAPPTGQLNPNSISVVIVADKSVIEEILDAAKESKKDPKKIPIEIVRKLAIKWLFESIGNYIMEHNICELFDQWSAGKKVGDDGYITINFILVEEEGADQKKAPVIPVQFYAKIKGQNTPTAGGVNSWGYVAPVNDNGNVTLEYDLFGDGEYVLKKLECD